MATPREKHSANLHKGKKKLTKFTNKNIKGTKKVISVLKEMLQRDKKPLPLSNVKIFPFCPECRQ